MSGRVAALLALAIVVGALFVVTAIVVKPTGFDRCVSIVSADIERQAAQTAATNDPRDVELSAARICAGAMD